MSGVQDEEGRIAALRRYGILDTPAEPEFDRITALAARLFRVPTAAITLVDAERPWSKSRTGMALPQLPRALAFCTHTVAGPDVLVVADALGDARFADNPLVAGEPRVRFYAGAPICTPDGHNIGSLELFDYAPRQLSSVEREMLANLAAVVMDELELRATARSRDTGTHPPAFRERADMRLAFVTQQLPAILWTTDRDLHVTSGIGAGLDTLKVHPDRLIGLTLQKAIGMPELGDPLIQAHQRALTGVGGSLDWSVKGRVWQCWVEPLRDTGESVVGVIGIALDITERRQLEARVVQSDRLASLGTLAAGVAHEINNPLTYVLTNIGFVNERLDALGDQLRTADGRALTAELHELRTALAESQEGATRVRQIVRDLRVYSRRAEDHETTVDVQRVLDWSINMTMNEIRHRAQLIKELAPVPPVRATETRLGQVFINLLVNAAQAIPAGSTADKEIGVSTWTDSQGHAVISVRDTGAGIAPEVLDHIFDPFFSTKPLGVGLGLGLFVCHGIIKALGGTLTARSTPGQGATFTVTLPPAELAVSPAPPAGDLTPSSRRARVLAIDDEPQVLRSLQRALAEHEVVGVDGAREALTLLAQDPAFDVILCDLMMGDMTGMDLHAALQARAPELAARVVFMTGGAFTDGARDFLAGVPNPCIEKPFDLPALRALVAGADALEWKNSARGPIGGRQ